MSTVSPETANDAFQRVADGINFVVFEALRLNVPMVLHAEGPPKDVGPLIVAVIAGTLNAAGRFCACYEPTLNGDVLAGVVADQFNAGRADQFALEKGARQ